jgi:hypothetical protein
MLIVESKTGTLHLTSWAKQRCGSDGRRQGNIRHGTLYIDRNSAHCTSLCSRASAAAFMQGRYSLRAYTQEMRATRNKPQEPTRTAARNTSRGLRDSVHASMKTTMLRQGPTRTEGLRGCQRRGASQAMPSLAPTASGPRTAPRARRTAIRVDRSRLC